MPELKDDDQELKELLRKLIQTQAREVSLFQTFLRGIVSGFGVFVGSAVLVALLIYILSLFNTAPIVGGYVEKIINAIKSR